MGTTGRFIVFEGGEGCGKSTQALLLARERGALITREPGGTSLGEQVRSLVLDAHHAAIDPRAELLLLVAARAQHVEEVIRPTLHSGQDVVCDRYSGSTLAYQGYGRGLPLEQVRAACALGEAGLQPDLTILLDVPIEESLERLSEEHDRIEQEDQTFHSRVRAGFLVLAEQAPTSWAVISGSGFIELVAKRVLAVCDERLGSFDLDRAK